jgi:transposase
LNTCQLKTLLVAEVPRVTCLEHGVVAVSVPWAESGSGFTALFEALLIDWLKAASISAVAARLRCGESSPRQLSVDETAYRKGHDHITVVTDNTVPSCMTPKIQKRPA